MDATGDTRRRFDRVWLVMLLWISSAGAIGAPIRGQQPSDFAQSVREFQRFFPTFKTTAERIAAVQTLEGNATAAAVRELLPLLSGTEPDLRAAVLQVLATIRDPGAFTEVLAELPRVKNQERLAQMIEVAANSGIVDVGPVLVDIATGRRPADATARYQAARAFGKLGGEAAAPALAALLQDRDAHVRVAAVDAVAALRLQALAGAVLTLLDDDAWQVQSAAVGTLAVLRPQEAIGPLIACLKRPGRIVQEAAEALFAITALDFGTDVELWERNWANLQSVQWRIPTDAELAKAKTARQRNDAYYGKNTSINTFAGIRTTSTRVLFIIDVSGSMDDRVVEVERFDAGYSDLRKLTIVKTELVRTLDALAANTMFNIMAFATECKAWRKDSVAANVVNKASAKAWVKNLVPIGGGDATELAGAGLTGTADLAAGKTNTLAAVMFPFGIDSDHPPSGPLTHGELPRAKLDTVFFLSDGRPSTGRLVDTHEILKELARVNEVYRLVFHTIAIGDFQKDFLRELAQQNGGVFVDLGR